MANVPISTSYSGLRTPSFSAPKLNAPTLNVPKLNAPTLNAPGLKIRQRPMKPKRRHVADIGDIILGNPITGTKQLRETLKDNGLEDLVYTPLLNRVAGFALMTKERFVEPLAEGKPGVAFINTLETFGNTLDIIANPIKSLMPWAGGGTAADFAKSMGWIEDEYREIYQWDTGSWIVDIAGEVISDPANWFTLGGKQLAKGGSDLLTTSARKVIKETAPKITDDVAEIVTRKYVRHITDSADDIAIKVLNDLQDTRKFYQEQLSRLTDKKAKALVRKNIRALNQLIEQPDLLKTMYDSIQSTNGYRLYRSAKQMQSFGKTLDDSVMKLALASTPLTAVGALTYKYALSPTFKHLYKLYVDNLKDGDVQKVLNNRASALRVTRKQIAATSRELHYKEWEPFIKILKDANVTDEALINLYKQVIDEYAHRGFDRTQLDEIFLDRIKTVIPELNTDITDTRINTQLKDLVRAVGEDAIVLANHEQRITAALVEQLDKDINDFFLGPKRAAKTSKRFQNYNVLERLDYIDRRLLTVNGKYYGLRKLDLYIREAHKLNPEALGTVMAILDYLGITTNNSKEIYNLMKAKDLDKLRSVIEFAKQGSASTKAILKEQAELMKFINRELPDIPLDLDDGGDAIRKFFQENTVVSTQDVDDLIHNLAKNREGLKQLKAELKNITMFDEVSYVKEKVGKKTKTTKVIKHRPHDLKKLDSLTEYLGFDFDFEVSTETLINDIMNYDGRKTSYSNLATFRANILELQQRVHTWRNAILDNTLRIKPDDETKKLVFNLYELLNDTITVKRITNLNDIMNLTDEVYRLTVSAMGRYGLIDLELQDPAIAKVFNELSNVKSSVRLNLQKVMRKLEKTPLRQNALYIGKILTRIDAHNAVARLLNTTLTSEQIPDAIKKYMTSELFNIIYANKHLKISEIDINKFVDKFMREFQRDCEKQLLEFIEDWVAKSDVQMDVLDDSLAAELADLEAKLHFQGLDDIDYLRYDELKQMLPSELKQTYTKRPIEFYKTFMSDLESNVHKAFKKYIKELNTIGRINHTMPNVYQHLDSESICYMAALGLDRTEIVDALKAVNASDVQIQSVETFINQLVGGSLDPELLNYSRGLAEDIALITSDGSAKMRNKIDAAIERMDKDAKVLIEDSLSKHLRQAYKNIDAIQSELSGEKLVLGKRWLSKTDYRNVKAWTTYVECNKVREFIRTNSIWENAYAWSNANQFLSFKVDIRHEFLDAHRLNAYRKVGNEWVGSIRYSTQNVSLKFYEYYKHAYDYVSELDFNNPQLIADMRQTLADVYKNPALGVAPIDPEAYFKTGTFKDGNYVPPISDVEVLAWANVTRKKSFDKVAASDYMRRMEILHEHKTLSFNERIDYYADPTAAIANLEETVQDVLITDPELYSQFYDEAPKDYLDMLYGTVERDFKNSLKDIDSLKEYEHMFSTHIQQSLDWLNNARVLDDIKMDERLVKDVVKDKKARTVLKAYGVDLEKSKMNSPEVLNYLFIERNEWFNYSMSKWDAKQLRSWLDHNTDGMFIYVDEVGNYLLRYTDEALAEAGLIREILPDAPNIYVVRRTDNKITNTAYSYLAQKSIFPEQQKIITDMLKKNRNAFNWTGMDVPDHLFTGQLMDNTAYEVIRKHDSIAKILGDDAEQKLYSKVDKNGRNTFHTKNDSRPNFSIIGSPSAFNKVLELCADDLQMKNVDYFKKTTNLIQSVWSGNLESIHRGNAVNKYAQLFFNDDYYMGNKIFKPILENATDEQLRDLFQRNGYKAVVLKETRSGKLKVFKVFIDNQKDLQNAIANKAIIVPHEVYRNMVLTINKDIVDSKLLNMYKRTIVGTFKSMYLNNLGFLMRNWLDSAVYKNNASYHGVAGMMDMFKYEYKAMKMLEWHDEIQRKVFALSDGQTFNRKNLRRVLADLTEEQRKTYLVIDAFVNSSASGGLSKSFDEFLLKRNKANSEFIGYAWEEWYQSNVLDTPIFSKIRDANSLIEQSSRFGLFLAMLDETGDYSKAIREVINTHFDYSLKEPGIELLEQFFWFSTFPINNFMYYINYGIVRNPDMLKLQMDMLEQSYNDDDNYTWEDVRNSDYLTYNAMTGNIRFYLFGNDKDDPTSRLIVKTGSSVLDFFSIMCDPIGQAKDRLNPFFSVLLGYEKPDQLLPWTSLVNRGKQFVKGNPVPSVFATLYPKKEYMQKQPTVYSNYTGSWGSSKKYYPKVRTYYQKQYYPQYHKRTYMNLTNVSYKWMKTTRGKKIYFYDNGSRIIRAAAKMRRAMSKAKMPKMKETRY